MAEIVSFLVSVAAGVIANYISKWLGRRGDDRRGQ